MEEKDKYFLVYISYINVQALPAIHLDMAEFTLLCRHEKTYEKPSQKLAVEAKFIKNIIDSCAAFRGGLKPGASNETIEKYFLGHVVEEAECRVASDGLFLFVEEKTSDLVERVLLAKKASRGAYWIRIPGNKIIFEEKNEYRDMILDTYMANEEVYEEHSGGELILPFLMLDDLILRLECR